MKTILVTGANRGLGLEFVTQFLELGYKVIASSRKITNSAELIDLKNRFKSRLDIFELDLLMDDSIEKFVGLVGSKPIDIFINNAGVMGVRNLQLRDVNSESWLQVFRVNTIAPLLLTQKLLNNILLGLDKKMFYISSRVGSIDENNGGALYAYRSSKTALNQVVKSLSIDLSDLGISAIALHPGWVLTEMGGPNALIETRTSVSGMISVIHEKTLEDSGRFFNYDGKIISW